MDRKRGKLLPIGIPVIAEGVEASKQLEMLEQFDCSAVQGFHLASPEPFSGLFERLQRRVEDSIL